jgi:hypothetical protein
MRRWRFQRGEISPGCIFGVIVLLIAVYIGLKTVPIMSDVAEFSDECSRIADKANSVNWREPKKMQEALRVKAQDLRLPISVEQIKVSRTEKTLEIKVVYDVSIDYGFYTYVWHKDINEFRPLF